MRGLSITIPMVRVVSTKLSPFILELNLIESGNGYYVINYNNFTKVTFSEEKFIVQWDKMLVEGQEECKYSFTALQYTVL